MKAMLLRSPGPIESRPLEPADLPIPEPGAGELLVRVLACGVCHTDLHVVEGELPLPKLPVVPGHQVVGLVEKLGDGAGGFKVGERVGVAWLYRTCGGCRFCRGQKENLCENAQFTGLHTDGGFAQYTRVPAEFAYRIPEGYTDVEAAPLLCSGIVGYRSLRRCGIQPGGRLGLYGFGGSAHIVIQVAHHWGCEVFVFTRAAKHQALAKELGAAWVGRAEEPPPTRLDSAILFAPTGALVPLALEAVDKGGTVALAGITMTPTPALDYARHLYHERTLTSVANATRQDGRDFLALAAQIRLRTRAQSFPLESANEVLQMLKESRIEASAVLELPH